MAINLNTSVVDALWMGIPVVTKIGQSMTARVCASLLNAFNLTELITKSNEDYKKLILKLVKLHLAIIQSIGIKTKKALTFGFR